MTIREVLRLGGRTHDAESGKVMMWGAPGGGKTTFLAALRGACLQVPDWEMWGTTEADDEYLRELQDTLWAGGFPPPNATGRTLNMRVSGPDPQRRLFGGRRWIKFDLTVDDIPGGYYDPSATEFPGAFENTVNLLAEARGLLYIYDPKRDLDADENLNLRYLSSAVSRLRGKLDGEGSDRKLPHYVAICVAKLDDPQVYDPAVEGGWVTSDQDGARMPRVADRDAKAFFEGLCERAGAANTRLLRAILRANFEESRTEFFVTSSIGFHLRPDGTFDDVDSNNVRMVGDEARIRSGPTPINVLEPVWWLERKIRAGAV